MKKIPLLFWLFVDGLTRFVCLSVGIWTDATVRGYNILGRSTRYLKDVKQEPTGMDKTSTSTDSLNEQVMNLIALTRCVSEL